MIVILHTSYLKNGIVTVKAPKITVLVLSFQNYSLLQRNFLSVP